MPRTIVVPLDRSEVAERALPIAQALARQLDARVMLLSVFEIPPEYAVWASSHEQDERWIQRSQDIETYLSGVASQLEPLDVRTSILTGMDPAIEVHEAVIELDDAILVISTQGLSGIKRLILGSKASRFVQLATYPVVVVPVDCDEYPSAFSRVLLPLDGSLFAEHALDLTLEFFTGEGRVSPSFHLLRVVDQIYVGNDLDGDLRNELVDEANRYLSDVADRLTRRGCRVSWDVEESYEVADKIVSVAHIEEVDLISLATHGRTGFSRFFLGSIADAVLRTATKPVLIVRPSEDVVDRAPESSRSSRDRS